MIFSSFKWNQSHFLQLSRPQKAYVYYQRKRLNLCSGVMEDYLFDNFLQDFHLLKMKTVFEKPSVFHFFYEFGFWETELKEKIDDDTPLVIELNYQSYKFIPIDFDLKLQDHLILKKTKFPSLNNYSLAFQEVQQHLLKGNCYQINLTAPFDFSIKHMGSSLEIEKSFFSSPSLGAYAHMTDLGPYYQSMILSNSPECLFEYKFKKSHFINSYPIKGTLKKGASSTSSAWKKLMNSKKDEGELDMITDLLRNDLNKIEYPCAEVLKRKHPVCVPGLIHQCSILSLKISPTVSLLKVLNSLFPGGSITGAPKMKVMKLVHEIEGYKRGLYCGSTLLCMGQMKKASINIRTAIIDLSLKKLTYGSGGGITLLSDENVEFKEMNHKVESFLTLFRGA